MLIFNQVDQQWQKGDVATEPSLESLHVN